MRQMSQCWTSCRINIRAIISSNRFGCRVQVPSSGLQQWRMLQPLSRIFRITIHQHLCHNFWSAWSSCKALPRVPFLWTIHTPLQPILLLLLKLTVQFKFPCLQRPEQIAWLGASTAPQEYFPLPTYWKMECSAPIPCLAMIYRLRGTAPKVLPTAHAAKGLRKPETPRNLIAALESLVCCGLMLRVVQGTLDGPPCRNCGTWPLLTWMTPSSRTSARSRPRTRSRFSCHLLPLT